jgi:pimeloyl-ACP methyl ester carboxylesterase
MTRTLFLPGAVGSASFWQPMARQAEMDGEFFAWPGLGNEPAQPGIGSIEDLVTMVLDRMTEPVNLVAQSMGGVVAMMAALAAPEKVARLVLTVTSAGVPMAGFGGSDWRPDYFQAFPNAARWIAQPVADLSGQIGFIEAPTLLLWGERDPISPVAVGTRLQALLPNAKLQVIAGADHDLARTHSACVAELVKGHLTTSAP